MISDEPVRDCDRDLYPPNCTQSGHAAVVMRRKEKRETERVPASDRVINLTYLRYLDSRGRIIAVRGTRDGNKGECEREHETPSDHGGCHVLSFDCVIGSGTGLLPVSHCFPPFSFPPSLFIFNGPPRALRISR